MGESIKQAAKSRVVAVVAFVGTVATWASSRFADPRPLGAADAAHVLAMVCSAVVGSVLREES